jgi:hypothetical protein
VVPSAIEALSLEIYWTTEACGQTFVVQVFAKWCGYQPDSSFMVSLARHDLQKICRKLLSMPTRNQMILWLLAVGGIGVTGTRNANGLWGSLWGTWNIAAFTKDIGIGDYEGFKSCLKRVVWHEWQDEPTHRELWEEVSGVMVDTAEVGKQSVRDRNERRLHALN